MHGWDVQRMLVDTPCSRNDDHVVIEVLAANSELFRKAIA